MRTRKRENDAFSAWIQAYALDPSRDSPKLRDDERAKPPKPLVVTRHTRQDCLLQLFEQNVGAWRFRCMNSQTEGTP